MNNLITNNTNEDNNDLQKNLETLENNDEKVDQLTIKDTVEEEFNKDLLEIFTNLDYPTLPDKLEKINLDTLLNYSLETEKETENKDSENEDELDNNFHIITSHSFNAYSVSSGLNKIKFLKNLKEENSKLESNYQVNTPSSENVQKSEILVTEDLDSLIKGVKSIPYIPKLEEMVPIPKRDVNTSSKKKKRNKRKRKSDRHYNENRGDRSPKSRKLIKNWDDKTIEEAESFDIEDKENSFEAILNQYNSMKQPAKDILLINQILNQPINSNSTNEVSTSDEKKTSLPSPSSSEIPNITSPTSEISNKLVDNSSPSPSVDKPEELTIKSGDKQNEQITESNSNETTNNDSSLKFIKDINKDLSDLWNKNSPISSTSSNSNMSDEETNYPQNINLKKHKLESLRYSSILTPPTPPQPLEEN